MTPGSPRKYAVFDIDGTVIRWQLYHAVASELAKRGKLSPDSYETIQAARLTWKQRVHQDSFLQYEQVLVKTYLEALKNLRVSEYLEVVDNVFEKYKDQVYTYTRDLIKQLKAQHYLLFAISGSQREIIAKLANYYGFDDFRGAEFEQYDGHFTGQVSTPYGRKLELLQAMLQDHNIIVEGSLAIGDSGTDIAVLETVERPIAFNPNQELFAAAKMYGWDIVIERKNVVYTLISSDDAYSLTTV